MRSFVFVVMLASCGGSSYDSVRAGSIATGQTREQVRTTMGAPDHMAKTMDDPTCVEAWSYGTEPRTFVVDFDAQGHVCGVVLPK